MEKLDETPSTNRESFVTEIKRRTQYFNDNSSLRGVGHVISLSKISLCKRLFWLLTLLACCFGSAVVLRGVLRLYTNDAVSYSVETNYLNWDTPFPAVTICEQLNATKVNSKLLKNNVPQPLFSFTREVAFWNKLYCKPCPSCELNHNCIDDYMQLVNIARASCEELLKDCSFDGEEFPCCERFKPMATEYGTCFVFNSKITGDGQIKINRKFRHPVLLFSVLWKATIKVHSPDEMISVTSENILGTCTTLPRISNFEVDLMAEEIVTDASVRSISQDSRDCLFKDELPDSVQRWPFAEYSYSACMWYCKTEVQVQLCNCTYHFMPRIEQVPVCDVQGLKCLNKYYDVIGSNTGKCKCPMSCDEVSYKVVHVSCPHLGLTDVLESRGSQCSVKVGQLPHIRVRRHAMRDMLGLVVDIGGVVGVFFGASLLSFLEIVYICCIRRYRPNSP